MTADDLLPILATGLIGAMFGAMAHWSMRVTAQSQTLAKIEERFSERISTLFKRLDAIEQRQDDHAEKQDDITHAVILQGSHIEQAVAAMNNLTQRFDAWMGHNPAPALPTPLLNPNHQSILRQTSKRRRGR